MKTGISALLLTLVLGGCSDDGEDGLFDDDEEDTSTEAAVSSPTLIVNNVGQEAALLELWYSHDGAQTYREVTLPAHGHFERAYPALGAVKLMAGRARDGFLLVEGTFGREDFHDNILSIEIRP